MVPLTPGRWILFMRDNPIWHDVTVYSFSTQRITTDPFLSDAVQCVDWLSVRVLLNNNLQQKDGPYCRLDTFKEEQDAIVSSAQRYISIPIDRITREHPCQVVVAHTSLTEATTLSPCISGSTIGTCRSHHGGEVRWVSRGSSSKSLLRNFRRVGQDWRGFT